MKQWTVYSIILEQALYLKSIGVDVVMSAEDIQVHALSIGANRAVVANNWIILITNDEHQETILRLMFGDDLLKLWAVE